VWCRTLTVVWTLPGARNLGQEAERIPVVRCCRDVLERRQARIVAVARAL
jgi:hypothetical protein